MTTIARRQEGQTTVEYAMVLLLIALVLVFAVASVTNVFDDLPQRFADALP